MKKKYIFSLLAFFSHLFFSSLKYNLIPLALWLSFHFSTLFHATLSVKQGKMISAAIKNISVFTNFLDENHSRGKHCRLSSTNH